MLQSLKCGEGDWRGRRIPRRKATGILTRVLAEILAGKIPAFPETLLLDSCRHVKRNFSRDAGLIFSGTVFLTPSVQPRLAWVLTGKRSGALFGCPAADA